MSDFLPDGYSVPSKGDEFMKWAPGDNTFRILDKPILGWETWIAVEGGGKKPIRVSMESKSDEDAKHFWAFPVYSFDNKKIQILIITQVGIQRHLVSLGRNTKWGNPQDYDIVVNKSGEGFDTEYAVSPNPKYVKGQDDAEIEFINKIKQQYKDLKINMKSIYATKQDPYGRYPISDAMKGYSVAQEDPAQDSEVDINDLPPF